MAASCFRVFNIVALASVWLLMVSCGEIAGFDPGSKQNSLGSITDPVQNKITPEDVDGTKAAPKLPVSDTNLVSRPTVVKTDAQGIFTGDPLPTLSHYYYLTFEFFNNSGADRDCRFEISAGHVDLVTATLGGTDQLSTWADNIVTCTLAPGSLMRRIVLRVDGNLAGVALDAITITVTFGQREVVMNLKDVPKTLGEVLSVDGMHVALQGLQQSLSEIKGGVISGRVAVSGQISLFNGVWFNTETGLNQVFQLLANTPGNETLGLVYGGTQNAKGTPSGTTVNGIIKNKTTVFGRFTDATTGAQGYYRLQSTVTRQGDTIFRGVWAKETLFTP